MIASGFIDEVRSLRETYPVWSDTARTAIGYEEILALLDNRLTLAGAVERIILRTRQFAKRQNAWIRHQLDPVWIETTPNEPLEKIAARVQEAWKKYPTDLTDLTNPTDLKKP